MTSQVLFWIGFIVFVLVMLVLDLKVFHRRAQADTIRKSLLWTAFWIVLSLLFNLIIYFWHGSDTAIEFLTAYLIEKSLSVDNLFVFLMIFSYFAVPSAFQHRVLYWGILGAIVMRLTFILAGVKLLEVFDWALYVFGAFLIVTSIRMAFQKDKDIHPEKNPVLRIFRRLMPITSNYEDDRFFVRRAGKFVATPLVVVVLVIETTDIVFALDSIPAVLGITTDTFIVFSSNVCAILGLRALYFALAGIMGAFYYLRYGLVAVLAFIGVKMLIAHAYDMPTGIALGVVATVLAASVILSMVFPRRMEPLPAPSDPQREEKPIQQSDLPRIEQPQTAPDLTHDEKESEELRQQGNDE